MKVEKEMQQNRREGDVKVGKETEEETRRKGGGNAAESINGEK